MMCKSKEISYTKDALIDVINELYYTDGYSWAMLADLFGYSESMMRSIGKGDRNISSENLLMGMRNLARDDNYRIMRRLVLPAGTSVHNADDVVVANGSLDDELVDGVDALNSARTAYNARNLDELDQHIENYEQVLDRMKHERAKLAGSK